jgi:hypothetical protein
MLKESLAIINQHFFKINAAMKQVIYLIFQKKKNLFLNDDFFIYVFFLKLFSHF